MLPKGDAELVRIVDAALQDAARRSGPWLACRPGCNQCCTGVFRISQLDAARLQEGLRRLAQDDPERARHLEQRVTTAKSRMAATYPGDLRTGILDVGEEADAAFESFGDDEVCPVLDPESGMCSLYAYRPMTCRTFGPAVRTEEGALGTCELCFVGAPEAAVVAAEMVMPTGELEATLTRETGLTGDTIVAFALL